MMDWRGSRWLMVVWFLFCGLSEEAAADTPRPLLRDFIGINGHTVQFRPELYAPVARLVRNYHPVEWDLGTNTTMTPPFQFAKNRVNWEHVYGAWRATDLTINASLMFESIARTNWVDLEFDARAYGRAFAREFGPSGTRRMVESAEIGNEPGDWSDADYTRIFRAMAEGPRDGDPGLQIVTCNLTTGPSGPYEKSVACLEGFSALYDVLSVHTYAQLEGWPTWRRSFPEDPRLEKFVPDIEATRRHRQSRSGARSLGLDNSSSFREREDPTRRSRPRSVTRTSLASHIQFGCNEIIDRSTFACLSERIGCWSATIPSIAMPPIPNCPLAALLLALTGTSLTALNPGDIAFTGYNADGEDNLAFVALAPIPGGTEIFFSDNEWNGLSLGGSGGFVDNFESELKWTAPAGGLSAGSVVMIDGIENSAPLTTSIGTIQYTLENNVGVGANGEAIFAFVGTSQTPEAFLAAIMSGLPVVAGNLNGTGLTLGTTAISISPGTPDIMAYVGPRSGEGAFSDYLALIHDPANWISEDGPDSQQGNAVPPDVPFDATPFTTTVVEGVTFEEWLALREHTSDGFHLDGDDDGLVDGVEYYFDLDTQDSSNRDNLPRILRNGADLELHFTRLADALDAEALLLKSSSVTGVWTPAVVDEDYEVIGESRIGEQEHVQYRLLPAGDPEYWQVVVRP